jgi:HAD superfamily hydrolase (TIGR01662 family)
MIKCILFDRDGTLGELVDKRYPESLIPYCDIKSVFTKLKDKGYIVGIITNQSSIARGTGANYDFDSEFKSFDTDIYKICPHDNADNCDCRKPKSGMLLSVMKDLNLKAEECIVVGDRITDVECAKNVGANAGLVLTGSGKNDLEKVKTLYPDTIILNQFDEILNVNL